MLPRHAYSNGWQPASHVRVTGTRPAKPVCLPAPAESSQSHKTQSGHERTSNKALQKSTKSGEAVPGRMGAYHLFVVMLGAAAYFLAGKHFGCASCFLSGVNGSRLLAPSAANLRGASPRAQVRRSARGPIKFRAPRPQRCVRAPRPFGSDPLHAARIRVALPRQRPVAALLPSRMRGAAPGAAGGGAGAVGRRRHHRVRDVCAPGIHGPPGAPRLLPAWPAWGRQVPYPPRPRFEPLGRPSRAARVVPGPRMSRLPDSLRRQLLCTVSWATRAALGGGRHTACARRLMCWEGAIRVDYKPGRSHQVMAC